MQPWKPIPMIWRDIHPSFRLNGHVFDSSALVGFAHSWIKKGNYFEKDIGQFLLDWLSSSEFITVKTSGSTGKPKQIELRKEFMVNSALATRRYFDLQPAQTALLCLSSKFIAGKMMLVRAMVLGLELNALEPSSKPLQHNSKQYDFAAMVPMQVSNSVKELNNVKKLIVGGAPISIALKERLRQCKTRVYETYGMTETITHIAAREISKNASNFVESNFEVLPNISISKDDRGCLVIDALLISEEQVVTNDLVELTGSNEFRWLGRWDTIINSGGIKLIPEEIEQKLSAVISNRFFVTGISDAVLGQKLVLLVEGTEIPNLNETIASIGSVSKFEIPKVIYYSPKFVETGSGKINRIKTLKENNLS